MSNYYKLLLIINKNNNFSGWLKIEPVIVYQITFAMKMLCSSIFVIKCSKPNTIHRRKVLHPQYFFNTFIYGKLLLVIILTYHINNKPNSLLFVIFLA